PAYGPQNDVTLKMPAFEWVHVQLHQQKGMISLSPPTICNSAVKSTIPTDEMQRLKTAIRQKRYKNNEFNRLLNEYNNTLSYIAERNSSS
ncbi:hypothetical protein, partial [Shewanella xiamenensis]|uniref:hypothetical protein n=1 Tax=Shewanella xiamenensis TaxID=332186 RepID=UPI0035A251A1